MMQKPEINSGNTENLSEDSKTLATDKRTCERIRKSICVKFVNGKSAYPGIIMNLSEKGMFIGTKETFPSKPKIEILIPLKKEVLKVHGKIKSFGSAGKIYNGIGVELLNPKKNYLKFISNLKTVYSL
ncbi:MAG: PilZ domain-containing protein [Candidatus Hodarchaeales archaeon]|jgi:hypothetical protein